MIQFVDEHTEPLWAGLDGTFDALIGRVITHAEYAINKYVELLRKQIIAASGYLDEFEMQRLHEYLENSGTTTKIDGIIRAEFNGSKDEAQTQEIYVRIVAEKQAKIAAGISKMVHTPIVLYGTAFESDIIANFYDVDGAQHKVTKMVWANLKEVIAAATKGKHFMTNEETHFNKAAQKLLRDVETEFALHKEPTDYQFQLRLDACIRKFYTKFTDVNDIYQICLIHLSNSWLLFYSTDASCP